MQILDLNKLRNLLTEEGLSFSDKIYTRDTNARLSISHYAEDLVTDTLLSDAYPDVLPQDTEILVTATLNDIYEGLKFSYSRCSIHYIAALENETVISGQLDIPTTEILAVGLA